MGTTHGVKLDEALHKRLVALGQLRDRTPHWLMRKAVQDYLDREERYEREKAEDMAEWEDYLLGGEVVDGESVDAWLGKLARGEAAKCPK